MTIPATLSAQSDPDLMVVGTVGGTDITYEELLNNYALNSTGSSLAEATYDELESFLPLYLDFRAKILAGKEMGYHKDSALVSEYENYLTQAAYSYWLEKEIKPSAFDEFKHRSGSELKGFHILIAIDDDASQASRNDALRKLEQAKSELENGRNPQEVNQKFSTVRNGRSMGGDIPWVTAGTTVKEFEDQIYTLEPGEISDPFRTQFGYHIVVLQDKRERTPSRLARHIYVRPTNDSTANQKITKAYQQLKSGTLWNQVVNAFSEDLSTIQNGGLIGWLNYQVASNSFIDTVMNVKTDVSFTEPKKTNYGFHIFKIDSVESYPDQETKDRALREQLEQASFYEANNDYVLSYFEEKLGRGIANEDIVEVTKEYYPEFEQQSESFMRGLIVFKLNEEQLWNPAKVDTARLQSMYHSNPANYQYQERSFYYLLTARHDSTLDKAIQFVYKGGSVDKLSSAIDGLRISSDSVSISFTEPFDRLGNMKPETFSNKFHYNNSRGVFWLQDKLRARKMTFDEAFNKLLKKYQPLREQEWLESLREKYDVSSDLNQLLEAYQKDS
ncbi:peptidylprolyl isomerase [Gracilimonas halophila]|uniref:Peptidylprolyl isomerase n=1 Tax=Gracilimonas halophila TaxID=1834464 RepID=A0ABW5JJL8_9BACT